MPAGTDTTRLPYSLATVGRARALVVDALTASGAGSRLVDDTNIVVGELVMNAVRHGRPDEHDQIDIWWAAARDSVHFSVRDSGRIAALHPAPVPGPDVVGGRGLSMVDVLCQSWDYDTSDGTRVTVRLRAA